MVDRFDMIFKNEECLSCHIIIIGVRKQHAIKEKIVPFESAMEVDQFSEAGLQRWGLFPDES